MKSTLSIVAVAVCLLALAEGQIGTGTGSVHCGVGCACSEEKSPVCGTDRLTYLNECVLRCRKCDFPGLERHYDGPCHGVIHFGQEYALAYPQAHLLSSYPLGELRSRHIIPTVQTVLPHKYARVVVV